MDLEEREAAAQLWQWPDTNLQLGWETGKKKQNL